MHNLFTCACRQTKKCILGTQHLAGRSILTTVISQQACSYSSMQVSY